jgi:hypothetical protein
MQFDALLYELFVYSYFLSPSFLRLLVRCFAQFQFTRPKDVDGARSLRFFFVGLVSINVFVLGRHFFGGETSVEGRGLLLDFVGRGLTLNEAAFSSANGLVEQDCYPQDFTSSFSISSYSFFRR